MSVRAATREDLPAVARLRPASFSRSQQPSEAHLIRYLDEVFFGNPWLDPELPSLVHEEPDGMISGFLGVIPRPWRMGETTLRGVAGTQLMVAPAQRGLAGIQLLQRFLKGPQDLVFSDAANEPARVLWLKLGGAAPLIYSMQWRIPLRAARSAARTWGTSLGRARLARVASPALAVVDSVTTAPVLADGSDRARAREAEAADFAAACVAAAGSDLRPDYSAEGLSWLSHKVAEKTGRMPRFHTFEGDRGPAGAGAWLLDEGVAQVIGLTCASGQTGAVVRALARLAYDAGAHTLEGRTDGRIGPALEGTGARIAREGPWALVHARSCEVRAALEAGRARASRFDGEWWTAF